MHIRDGFKEVWRSLNDTACFKKVWRSLNVNDKDKLSQELSHSNTILARDKDTN